MTHTVRLPNGFVMNGVPDDATQQQIAEHAITKGYAKPVDFMAYPDVYNNLPGVDKGSAAEQALGATPSMIAAAKNYAQSPLHKTASQLTSIAGGLALLPEEGAAAVAKGSAALADAVAAEMGTNTASALAGDLSDTKEETGKFGLSHAKTDVAEGMALPVAFRGIGAAVAPIVKGVFERFSPRTAAVLKGVADGGGLEREPVAEEVKPDLIADVVPGRETEPLSEKLGEQLPEPLPEKSGEPIPEHKDPWKQSPARNGERTNPEDLLTQAHDTATAEQALYDQQAMEHATRYLSAIEANSYIGAALKADKTGAKGGEVLDALNFYRRSTGSYTSNVLPHAGAELEHLKEVPYYEALMRADVGELDRLIQAADKGEEVNPAHMLSAVEAYLNNTKAQLMAFTKKNAPASYIKDLDALMSEIKGIDNFISEGAKVGRMPEQVAAQVRKDYAAGLVAATRTEGDTLALDLSKAADQARIDANKALKESKQNPRLKAVVTALNHQADTLEQMSGDIMQAQHSGKWSAGADEASLGALRAMAATHAAAAPAEKLYMRYRRIRSAFQSLPALRDEMTATPGGEQALSALETILTVKTLGANKLVKRIAGEKGRKAVAAPVARVRRKIAKRQLKNDIKAAIEKSQSGK